ncbi:MAG: TonB-dependent receptor [Pseudomonadota bacterium]
MTHTKKTIRSTRAAIAAGLLGCTSLTPAAVFAQEGDDEADTDDVIVVTTQRREQNVLDVPYNISVIGGDAIEGSITFDNAELFRSVPGVSQIDQGPRNIQFNSIRIRGLNVDSSAFGDFLLGSVPTVSTYVNETPVFANLALIDLDRVEVQRGPQATLYGSGALGGTVKYFTRQPQLGEVEGRFTATGSQVDGSESFGYTTGGVFNVPLGDKFALRANILWQDFPGVTDYTNLYVLDANGVPTQPQGLFALGPDAQETTSVEDVDDYQSLYGRVSLRFAPNDAVDIVANYFYQNDESGGRRQPSLGSNGLGEPYGEYENGAVIREPADRELNLASLEANVDLGFATLTSASSYYENEGSSETDNTGFFANNLAQFYYSTYYVFPRPLYTADRTFTDESFVQELRLVSNGENFIDWVVGVFYQDQTRGATQLSDLVGFDAWASAFFLTDFVFTDNVFTFERSEDYEEIAIFGEATVNVTEKLALTGGLRYFDNESTTDTFVRAGLYTFFNGEADTRFTEEDSRLLYRANASYQYGDDDLVYVTVSEGYRRGGSNGVPTVGQFANNPAWLTFESDTVTNYEIGFKGTLSGVRYDLNGFYIDWEDPQFNTSTPNGFFFAVANAQEARTAGLEAQFSGSAIEDRMNWALGYTYIDAELTADFSAPPAFGSTTPTPVAAEGSPLPGVSEHVVNIALDYTQPINATYSLISRLDGFWQSETQNVLDQNVQQATAFDGFAIFDATFTLASGKWDASFFIKNIANEDGVTGAFTEGAFGPQPAADYFGSNSRQFIALPRTFGIATNIYF